MQLYSTSTALVSKREWSMVFIYLEFLLCFFSLGYVPENWGMAQNRPHGNLERNNRAVIEVYSIAKHKSRVHFVNKLAVNKIQIHFPTTTLCMFM